MVTEATRCRACGGDLLDTILDLGNLCISDFVTSKAKPDRAPLELTRCSACGLVQLRHTVSRDRLYRNYSYHSGMNESIVAALRDVVDEATTRHKIELGDYLLDIGANDGTLLRMYPQVAWRDGFEPSQLAEEARTGTDHIWQTYFPNGWVPEHRYDIITSIACFYDVDEPGAFVEGIRDWLRPDGIWINQMSDLGQMLAANAFDNICHEHLTYWSYHPFQVLCRDHGLRVTSMSMNDVNGGSVRYVVEHDPRPLPKAAGGRVEDGTGDIDAFAKRVQRLRTETLWLLRDLKARGLSVVGYGASTKGNTLLQYYGITRDLLPMIADRNPEKWGKYTVGSSIPIVSEEAARATRPDYLFILPWAAHFVEAFKVREADFLARGGKFIVPLPSLRIVGGDDGADLQPQDVTSGARD